jgi:2-polyprenyl-6-hydroxyphenyl methylase/3-demethylubiquinone-9 3-methyltransferase
MNLALESGVSKFDYLDACDHGSHTEFYEYYAKMSLTPGAQGRFRAIRDTVLRYSPHAGPCDVADIGCGAGTQSMVWAELGHRVRGLDINQPLLDLAGRRSADAGYSIEFAVGSAVSLPWPDESVDICLAIELLEHVADWQACLQEFTRILRPGGVLFLTTSNKLCPVQQEFDLPLYSWYPAAIKRYCERLATTTHPHLVNYAKYPATNWFSFYELSKELARRDFDSFDRFDLINTRDKSALARAVVACIRAVPPLRWLAHIATPGTTVLAVKRSHLT